MTRKYRAEDRQMVNVANCDIERLEGVSTIEGLEMEGKRGDIVLYNAVGLEKIQNTEQTLHGRRSKTCTIR